VCCAWIAKHKAAWPILFACEVLGVIASGYFDHRRRLELVCPSRPSGTRVSNEELLTHICTIQAETKGEHGWPRMWKELLARGAHVGKDRV
jgi:hypothetical protein